MGAGKILQMVSGAWETVGEKEASVVVSGKRIEGAREKKNRGPRESGS